MTELLEAYFELHDMLSDMIEGGRLTEALIPDDYQALLVKIFDCNQAYYEYSKEMGDENHL